MVAELSYESLRRIQVAERTFGALSSLDEDFYGRYAEWLEAQKLGLQSNFSIDRLKAYENSKKIISEVSSLREQKILLRALKDYRSGSVHSDGLTAEEKRLYLETVTLLSSFEGDVRGEPRKPKKDETLPDDGGSPLVPPHLAGGDAAKAAVSSSGIEVLPSSEVLQLTFLKDVQEFVAPDGIVVGPFKSMQNAVLGGDVARMLVRKGAAELAGEKPEKSAGNITKMTGMDGDKTSSDIEFLN